MSGLHPAPVLTSLFWHPSCHTDSRRLRASTTRAPGEREELRRSENAPLFGRHRFASIQKCSDDSHSSWYSLGMRWTICVVIAGLVAACGGGPSTDKGASRTPHEFTAESETPSDDMSYGQDVVQKLRSARCAALWKLFSSSMRGALGSEQSFLPSCQSLAGSLVDATLASEEMEGEPRVYVARYQTEKGVVRITVASSEGKIDGLLIKSEEPPKSAP